MMGLGAPWVVEGTASMSLVHLLGREIAEEATKRDEFPDRAAFAVRWKHPDDPGMPHSVSFTLYRFTDGQELIHRDCPETIYRKEDSDFASIREWIVKEHASMERRRKNEELAIIEEVADGRKCPECGNSDPEKMRVYGLDHDTFIYCDIPIEGNSDNPCDGLVARHRCTCRECNRHE
jgi:hypothetical protein